MDAVEVQLGSGRELATAQFKVTVTRVSGQKDNPAPILMSTNGKEPLEMREISGMVAGDQETYTFTEILSKGSHQVVISVGDSDKSVVLTVPRPPIGTPAVAAIGQPIATATPKLPPILRIAPNQAAVGSQTNPADPDPDPKLQSPSEAFPAVPDANSRNHQAGNQNSRQTETEACPAVPDANNRNRQAHNQHSGSTDPGSPEDNSYTAPSANYPPAYPNASNRTCHGTPA